jgi:hypothetical protein
MNLRSNARSLEQNPRPNKRHGSGGDAQAPGAQNPGLSIINPQQFCRRRSSNPCVPVLDARRQDPPRSLPGRFCATIA